MHKVLYTIKKQINNTQADWWLEVREESRGRLRSIYSIIDQPIRMYFSEGLTEMAEMDFYY